MTSMATWFMRPVPFRADVLGGFMIQTQDWLPIGSVVHVATREGLYFIIGYLQLTEEGVWDYGARPYPMGYMGDDYDIYFDKDAIDGIYYLGFESVNFDQHQNYLKSQEAGIAEMKRRFARGATIEQLKALIVPNFVPDDKTGAPSGGVGAGSGANA